ncbi:MAG TPA: cytochrome P450 [Planctomycetota bacterium]|nr:cytochrome P450 [Planctomycetota bacterium]
MSAALILPAGLRAPAAWQLFSYSRSPLALLEEGARRHGEAFTLRLAGYGQLVILSDPAAVRDVFRGDPRVLHSGEGNEFLSASVGKTSVLVLDEEPHERQRRALGPPLMGEPLRSHAATIVDTSAEVVRGWEAGRTLPMLEPMRDITLRVILRAVLGLTGRDAIADVAQRVQRVLELGRGRYGMILVKVLPVPLMLRTPGLPWCRHTRALDEALLELVDALRRRPPAERGTSVLADVLATRHADGRPLSDREIRDALVTLIFAGHDTTSVALAWALEQIVPRADVVERLEDELQRVTGGSPPRGEQVARLEVLDAALRESLRVRTIMPFVVRLTKQPFTAGGREYPAGVLLCPSNHLVHRREDLYPAPGEFRLDRFLQRRFGPHEWFPFGGGNRACLGMAFALFEMKLILATVFAGARLARPRDGRSAPLRRGIMLAPDDGARITVVAKRGP